MSLKILKWPLLVEVLINGFFVILYTLDKFKSLPPILRLKELEIFVQNAVYFAPVFVLLTIFYHTKQAFSVEDFFRKYIFSLIIFIPMVLTWGDLEFCYWLSVVHLFSTILTFTDTKTDIEEKQKNKNEKLESSFSMSWNILHLLKLKPAQVVILSFGIIIFLGTLLLSLPISLAGDKKIAFIDAIFMSTSATCVTGLVTKSLVDDFSLFGQIVVLILLQVGGLGIMTLSSSLSMIMGKSLGVKDQILMQGVLDTTSSRDLLNLIKDIIKFTFVIELIGAIILSIGFYFQDFELGQSIYLGVFHSVSAFCNGGIALFNNSLEDFSNKPLIVITISILIIAGGLGFSVIQEIINGIKNKKKFVNYSVHTKVVVSMNIALLSLGFCYLFFGEFLHSMTEMSITEKIQVSFFQSVTTRTAGFNSINLNLLHPHSLYLMVLLMFIGASPGGTGGGVKVTTFAILLQSIRSTLRNKDKVEIYEKTVSQEIVVKAIAIFILSLMFVSLVILLMMRFEVDKPFFPLLFEVVSAFGTVGLSLGITPSLSMAGKIGIIILMFIGRVGPLTLILALQSQKMKQGVRYPEGRILIG